MDFGSLGGTRQLRHQAENRWGIQAISRTTLKGVDMATEKKGKAQTDGDSAAFERGRQDAQRGESPQEGSRSYFQGYSTEYSARRAANGGISPKRASQG